MPRFPWSAVKGWKVSSLANGHLLIEPDYVRPYRPDEGGGPGLLTRLRMADWVLQRLSKRRVNSADQLNEQL